MLLGILVKNMEAAVSQAASESEGEDGNDGDDGDKLPVLRLYSGHDSTVSFRRLAKLGFAENAVFSRQTLLHRVV